MYISFPAPALHAKAEAVPVWLQINLYIYVFQGEIVMASDGVPLAEAAEYLIEVGAHPQDNGNHTNKGSSQYRGVSWHERSQRWEVRVWGGGKQHFIGECCSGHR